MSNAKRTAGEDPGAAAEKELPPGDSIFLSFLLWGPMSAYDIKKIMAVSVSFFWSAAHSQVYQQAARLVRDGYLTEREAPGGRRKKILSLTPAGRAAVKRWLASPAGPPEFFDQALAKLFFGHHAQPEQMLEMAEHYRETLSHRMAEFQGIRAALESTDYPEARYQLLTLRLGIRVVQSYLEWLDDVVDELS